ncbi:hypothetical protein RJ639_004624 [Escallonia herrerae]|uniref:C2 domain-containing protein n=1 Tax=Escallonia herrerae TaxID=1293975 RepID=A0AA89AW94_9ASTE|nr:hypothetical protein RJ639_004624 [Escallonia herrerae]
MEVAVMSAQGLKNTSSGLFSRRLRPFITLTTVPPNSYKPVADGGKDSRVYRTRVDDGGGVNPTWGDKFHLPIDASFFHQRHSCIYLQLYTKRVMVGPTQLGWCQIPAGDILDGLSPAGSVRRLSYRLRNRDGSRGHGVVNVAVKLEASFPGVHPQRPLISGVKQFPAAGGCRTVIGIPLLWPLSVQRDDALLSRSAGFVLELFSALSS